LLFGSARSRRNHLPFGSGGRLTREVVADAAEVTFQCSPGISMLGHAIARFSKQKFRFVLSNPKFSHSCKYKVSL
jgi:hypothetical protein